MRQLAPGRIVLALLLLCLSTVRAALTIRRNTQDCIYPAIAANAARLWPTSSYLPRGNTIRILQGGYMVDSTAGFSIEYYGTYKVITNKLINEKYVLYYCSTAPPTVAGVTHVFQGPLTSASVADATAADFMTQLNLMDRVAYAGELAVSGCLQAMAACGYVAADNPDTDTTVKGNVDSMWVWGYSPTTEPKGISFNAPAATKPLERLKWISYVAAFFNNEYAANKIYTDVRDNYMALRRAALAQRTDPPLVCWVFKDWDGDYAMSFAQYKVEYVTDAGGRMYAWKDLTDVGMVPKPPGSTTTLVYAEGKADVAASWGGVLSQCDIIVDESWEMSTGGLTQMDAVNPPGFLQTHGIVDYADQIPAVTSKQVYTIAGTTGVSVTNPNSPNKGYIGLDWFERGVSRCDEVLRDLVKAISPTLQHPQMTGWNYRFLLRLDGVQKQQQIQPVCDLATVQLKQCRRAGYAARICPNAVRNCDTGVLEYPRLDERCKAVDVQRTVRVRRRRQVPRVAECQAQPA